MKAGNINSCPTVLCPTCSWACKTMPAKAARDSRGDKRNSHVENRRYPVQFGRAWAVADNVKKSAKRQIVEHAPKHDRDREHVDYRQRYTGEWDLACDRHEISWKQPNHLPSASVPLVEAKEQRAGTERRDEGVDARASYEQAVDQSDNRADTDAKKAGNFPRQALLCLEPVRKDLGDAEDRCDGQVEVVGGDGDHHRQGDEQVNGTAVHH